MFGSRAARVGVQERADRLVVRARGVHDLAGLVIERIGGAPVLGIEVEVKAWRVPTGWVGAPGLAGLTAAEVERTGDGACVRLTTTEPTDPGILLAAALRMLRPVPTGSVHPRLTFAPGLPAAAATLAPLVRDVVAPDETVNPHLRRTEVLIAPAGYESAGYASVVDRLNTTVIEPDGTWRVTDTGRPTDVAHVYVDPAVHRPFGRRSDAPATTGTATVAGGSLTIDGAIDGDAVSLRIDGDLRPTDVATLRGLRALVVTGDLGARWTSQLSACGVLLADDQASLPAADDWVAWNTRSVAATRDAMRTATSSAAWDAWPSVSAVLVTHRDGFIDDAVRRLAALDYPRLQIVIGRHGDAFDPARLAPLHASGHDVLLVDLDGDTSLGEAMQCASARASGSLIAKIDDDDHYAPTHIWDLVIARMHSGAQLVGKALDWVYLEGEDTMVFRPAYAAETYATFVAGGTMLIAAADLGAVGGWAPVRKSVDRALIDRVKSSGGLVYRTNGIGYVYVRHSGDHTASVRAEHFLTKTTATYSGLLADDAFGTTALGTDGVR